MSQIGSTEALEAYLTLQKENERLRQENRRLQYLYDEYRVAWDKVSGGVNTLFNWLETRKDTKTITVQHRMAEIFRWAYMEAHFEDLRAAWPCAESRAVAAKMYPSTVSESMEDKKQ